MRLLTSVRTAVLAGLLLIAGCTGSPVPHRTVPQAESVTGAAMCPVAGDIRTFQPAPLPTGLLAVGVQSCVVNLAARPGRGYWVQVLEKHALGGGAAYVRALRLPTVNGFQPHGCFGHLSGEGSLPAIVDTGGKFHYPRPPANGCTVRSEVTAALSAIRWSPVRVRWINQLLLEGADTTCLPTWRTMDHGQQAPIATANSMDTFAPSASRKAVCYAVPPRLRGPEPDDLVAALVVSDRAVAAPMLAALSRMRGADGCRSRAFEAFRVFVAARQVAIADLGRCVRVLPIVRRPPAVLSYVATEFADPWEIFDNSYFTTFVPADMYASEYGLVVIRAWRGYVARRYLSNPCRGFVDVSKCTPARATPSDPIALTFTNLPATQAQRTTRAEPGQVVQLSNSRWQANGLSYQSWTLLLPCSRVIGVTASILTADASELSVEADEIVQSVEPGTLCS